MIHALGKATICFLLNLLQTKIMRNGKCLCLVKFAINHWDNDDLYKELKVTNEPYIVLIKNIWKLKSVLMISQ